MNDVQYLLRATHRMSASLLVGFNKCTNLSWDTSGDDNDFNTLKGLVELVGGITFNLPENVVIK